MNFSKLTQYYSQLAVILFNTLLFFILLNLAAAYFLSANPKDSKKKQTKNTPLQWVNYPVDLTDHFEDPDNLLYKVYPGHTAADIQQPKMTNHPILGMATQPGLTGEYHVGKEGIRFDDFVTPDNIDSLINDVIWLFGGSTMYGHCMAQSETISNYLNQVALSERYINFGTPAYNQSIEINKLLRRFGSLQRSV